MPCMDVAVLCCLRIQIHSWPEPAAPSMEAPCLSVRGE